MSSIGRFIPDSHIKNQSHQKKRPLSVCFFKDGFFLRIELALTLGFLSLDFWGFHDNIDCSSYTHPFATPTIRLVPPESWLPFGGQVWRQKNPETGAAGSKTREKGMFWLPNLCSHWRETLVAHFSRILYLIIPPDKRMESFWASHHPIARYPILTSFQRLSYQI